LSNTDKKAVSLIPALELASLIILSMVLSAMTDLLYLNLVKMVSGRGFF